MAEPPVLKNGFVTFGSFNALWKINGPLLQLWARVLHAVPGSRMLMKADGLEDAAVAARIADVFGRRGDRRGPAAAGRPGTDLRRPPGGVRRVRRVPGHVSRTPAPPRRARRCGWACRSSRWPDRRTRRAWARACSRRSASATLAAASEDAFVATAAGLASDVEQTASLRREMRERVRRSPLADAVRLTRAIEDAFRAAWGSATRGT